MVVEFENYRKIDNKRKVFARGKHGNKRFKRFKRTPKYIKDNPENQVAREKEKLDVFNFTDSSDEDNSNELGMGLELSDLPFLDDNHEAHQQKLIALTQDSVRPFFTSKTYDESKLVEGLVELKYSSFRPHQKETITRILQGRSTLFISPTGSGKSLCYQLPALLYWRYCKFITIVVSPLISLMEDQMNNFPSKVLKAVSLHSNQPMSYRRKSIEHLVNGEAQVAFITPEAIVGGLLSLEDLKNLPPVGFVCIDEAHCLSEWSHNFRPAYLQFFKILHEQMSIKTFLGLTATATKATSFAISKTLIINPETDVIGATKIPENLILSVSYETNKEKALINLLKSKTFRILTSIIVYCNRREDTEFVAQHIRTAMQDYATLIEAPERRKRASLNDSNASNSSSSSSDRAHMKLSWDAQAYHAGLSSDHRKRVLKQFVKGEIRVVVATIAFGMGINKSNVRAIIHYDMPSSFESYVQEIGRAGRDGKAAQCHMFLKANKTDMFYQQRNIYSSTTERQNLKKLTEYLFRPACLCSKLENSAQDKLEKLNAIDQHEIKSEHKTLFINTPIVKESKKSDDDDSSDDDIIYNTGDSAKENTKASLEAGSPTRYCRKSIVRKHRRCDGHEKAFSIDEAVQELNLKVESIITLIYQIQKAYPQLKIVQHPPTRSTCNLLCYNGPAQMEALAKSNKLVGAALFNYKMSQLKQFGNTGNKKLSSVEVPNKLQFDIIEVASAAGLQSSDSFRLLKKAEWELVEKTGKFRKSQVKINFDGNSFHLTSVGDLDDKEMEEIDNFLFDFTKLYERIEREKVAKVFNVLKRHCIPIDEMSDKKTRLESSLKLKMALDAYFDRKQLAETDDGPQSLSSLENSSEDIVLSKLNEESIRKKTRDFISAHREQFTPRQIARIFQGISTPRYPAEIWGTNRKWWRAFVDVDFLKLESIIQAELVRSAMK